MSKIKVVFVDVKDYEKKYIDENMPDQCEIILFKETLEEVFENSLDKIKDAEILSLFTCSNVSAQVIEQLPNLKLIPVRSTGYNHVDIDFCKNRGIAVVNVPRYGESTVAEFAFGLLLNISRKINLAYTDLQKGIINIQGYTGTDITGKTIGIIGTGSIGRYAIKIALGFNMKVLAYDPFPNEELKQNPNVRYVDPDELYRESDIISIHAPGTKQNIHMINDAAFSKMKKGVIIINTARGEIIDTEALYKYIRNGIVAGAGLDVLECEDIIMQEDQKLTKIDCIKEECLRSTLINHRLLELPNVIVTPHVAFDSIEAIHRILEVTINNIKAYISGNIQNKVN